MEKPFHPRTSARVDSRSVDTTSGGEQRDGDNAKNVDGRKRHIEVDSMGLLLAVLVTAAAVDDARAATELFASLDGQPVALGRRHGPTLGQRTRLTPGRPSARAVTCPAAVVLCPPSGTTRTPAGAVTPPLRPPCPPAPRPPFVPPSGSTATRPSATVPRYLMGEKL